MLKNLSFCATRRYERFSLRHPARRVAQKTEIFEVLEIMKKLKILSTSALHENLIKRNFRQ